MKNNFEIIVIGAGHAGIEASLAAARMGMKTGLFTINRDKIGFMSCNPAIGGLAKGQLVREIDALGGEMAKAADATCIQFKVLNSGKGPAVRGLRGQADMRQYSIYMKNTCERTENLYIIEAAVEEILTSDSRVEGVMAGGRKYGAKSVIVTAGTFLNGLMHFGMESRPGGRLGDPPAVGLSASLKRLGISLGRLKTGTCPRVDRKSLDFSFFTEQPGDNEPVPFSFSTDKIRTRQELCWLVNTNELTAKAITDNLDKSPLYSSTGRKIFGIGPRYCPSIEDKIVKFPEKKSHQVFIEPQERHSDEMYLNGLSTSLPIEVQYEYLKTIPGFKNVKILKPGYGIEYDFIPPLQTLNTLESRIVPGLYFAGQVNGTSGYEEAAAQGLIAGINAALKILNKPAFVTDRSESYIGVMIDDLTTREIKEPYRLFSSRAEYRLVLRNDNADIRLMEYGKKFGLISEKQYGIMAAKKTFLQDEIKRLGNTHIHPSVETDAKLKKIGTSALRKESSLLNILKRPEVSYTDLRAFTAIDENAPGHFIDYLDAEIHYEGYIKKHVLEIEQFKKLENKQIPPDFDYRKIKGFSKEAHQKLSELRPKTVGQASRIEGITPADVNVLLIMLKKFSR
ncbi:MAG TPA: tRNA uridine-5-carboxymethylaminomethyl(34) synthesis enzyme MnmG [Candidatus Goldiibacteriota bacterium]|nr:tRNA uridine-5-carboxymethylaminomethyl(34) synthesis enzyme MnmG [Candidatus Goldiibacteriota bacterium]